MPGARRQPVHRPGLPVVGVSAYEEEATWGVWKTTAALIPSDYVHAVVAAGAVPVVLPVQSQGVAEMVGRLDALVLSGGPDVEPGRYGAAAGPHTDEPRTGRDDFELALLAEAQAAGLPVLAICRGMQLLNVARGGTLLQHVPDAVGSSVHRPTPGVFARQEIHVETSSLLAEVLGSADVVVACHHHQAVDGLGKGLEPVAWSADGLVEAVEDRSGAFLLGVQWHPEVGADHRLFAALVEAASPSRPSGT